MHGCARRRRHAGSAAGLLAVGGKLHGPAPLPPSRRLPVRPHLLGRQYYRLDLMADGWQTHVTDFAHVSWTSWSAAAAPCVSGPGAGYVLGYGSSFFHNRKLPHTMVFDHSMHAVLMRSLPSFDRKLSGHWKTAPAQSMPVPHSNQQCGKSRNRECGQVCQHD